MSNNEEQPMFTRREILKWGSGAGVFSVISGSLMYGEITGKGPEDPIGPSGPYNETETPAPTSTPTPTPTARPMPQSGTLNIQLEGETPWTEEHFTGDVDLKLDKKYDELRKEHHYDRFEQIDSQVIKEFPHNIDDEQWIRENLFEPAPDYRIKKDAKMFFDIDAYTEDGTSFIERMENSRMPDLMDLLELNELGNISSDHDDFVSYMLSATEKYQAENENFFTHSKTHPNGRHGLVDGCIHISYDNPANPREQTVIVETDPNEDQPSINFGKVEEYINDPSEQHTAEIKGDTREGSGWNRMTGEKELENITIKNHEKRTYEEGLLNPETQPMAQYLDTAAIAREINKQATQEGLLPEFQKATLHIHPDHIEYELAK